MTQIDALEKISKIFYDDTTFIILNFIIQNDPDYVEVSNISDSLNIDLNTVINKLYLLKKHEILISRDYNKNNYLNNPENNLILNKKQNNNKEKTEWKLNENFYNNLKDRFEATKLELEKVFKERETLKFICNECQRIYDEREATIDNNFECKYCKEKNKCIRLQEKKEDLSELRKNTQIILEKIKDIFDVTDGNLNINQKKKEKYEMKFEINNENEISFLEKKINKNNFYNIMDYFISKNIGINKK